MTDPTEHLGASAQSDAGLPSDGLGQPIAVFQASGRTRLVLAVCGAVMVGFAFVAFIIWGWPVGRYLPVKMASVGVVVLLLAFALGRQQTVIYFGGVGRFRGRLKEYCRWGQISEIVVSLPAGGGFHVQYQRCSLLKRDGSRIDLLDLNVGQFGDFVNTLHQASEPHGIPWREEVIASDGFGWVRWLIYGLIAFAVVMLIVATLVVI
jgi:hypothetical protein